MHDQTVGEFLASLSARTPALGGGASAALHLGQAAALLGMVARYSTGPRYQEHAELIAEVTAHADQLREDALRFAAQDAEAFQVVADAYALAKDSDEARRVRSEAIARASVDAAQPSARVVEAAGRLVGLAERLAPVGNRNVLSDVAAAAQAARAAVLVARMNIQVNLVGAVDAVMLQTPLPDGSALVDFVLVEPRRLVGRPVYPDDHRGRDARRLKEPAPRCDPLPVAGEDESLRRFCRDVHRHLPATVERERLGDELARRRVGARAGCGGGSGAPSPAAAWSFIFAP